MKKSVISIPKVGSIGIVILLSLVLAFISNTVHAEELYEASHNNISDLEYGISITYNTETEELTYGQDQQGTISDEELAEGAITNSNISSPFGIIGSDDRWRITDTEASPYRNVCYVISYWPDGTVDRGSGTLTYFNVLLTAGHMAYSHDHGGWAKSMTVIPAKNGSNNPLGTATSTNITCSSAWVNNCDHDWDWAIVDLNKSFDTWQLYGYYTNSEDQVRTFIQTVGYPGDHDPYMYSCIDLVTAAGDRWLQTESDWVGGDSGGAIINVSNMRLVGLISCELSNNGQVVINQGVRINEDLFTRLKMHAQEVS